MSEIKNAIQALVDINAIGQRLSEENEALTREVERLRRFEAWAQRFVETAKYGLPPQGTWHPDGEEMTRDEFCDEIARELINLLRGDVQS